MAWRNPEHPALLAVRSAAWLVCVLLYTPIFAQIVNVEDLRIQQTNDSIRWYGNLSGGFNYVRFNEEAMQISLDTRVQYKKRRFLTLMVLNGALLRAGSQDFNNSAFAHMRFNYKLLPRLTGEAFGQIQQNRLILLRRRSLLGAGLRLKMLPLREAQQPVSAYLGLSMMREENLFKTETQTLFFTRMSSYLSVTVRFNERVTLISTTYWQPLAQFIANYRAMSDWRLIMPLGRRLSFNAQFTWTRETYLPDNAPPESVTLRNALTWRF